jgi:hypothetical protein
MEIKIDNKLDKIIQIKNCGQQEEEETEVTME